MAQLRAHALDISEYNCTSHREDEPSGYLEWHAWARRMGKTHIQHRCPECGLYKIWIKRGELERIRSAEAAEYLRRHQCSES